MLRWSAQRHPAQENPDALIMLLNTYLLMIITRGLDAFLMLQSRRFLLIDQEINLRVDIFSNCLYHCPVPCVTGRVVLHPKQPRLTDKVRHRVKFSLFDGEHHA